MYAKSVHATTILHHCCMSTADTHVVIIYKKVTDHLDHVFLTTCWISELNCCTHMTSLAVYCMVPKFMWQKVNAVYINLTYSGFVQFIWIVIFYLNQVFFFFFFPMLGLCPHVWNSNPTWPLFFCPLFFIFCFCGTSISLSIFLCLVKYQCINFF